MATKKFDIRQIVVIVVVIVAAILLAITIYLAIEAPKTANIDIVVAPVSSDIRIGGLRFKNGNHRIEPGTYDVEITKEGFGSYSGQITLKEGETEKLYICLQKDQDNTEYYSSNQEDADACYQVEEYNFEKLEGEKYTDPIFQVAPYHSYSRGFYVDPYLDEDDSVRVKITITTCISARAEGLKQNAIDWLAEKGIDINNYQVEYSSCAYGN